MKRIILVLVALFASVSVAYAEIKWPNPDASLSGDEANRNYICKNTGKYWDRHFATFGSNVDCAIKMKEFGNKPQAEKERLNKLGCGEMFELTANPSDIVGTVQKAQLLQALIMSFVKELNDIVSIHSVSKEEHASGVSEVGRDLVLWQIEGYKWVTLTHLGCNIIIDIDDAIKNNNTTPKEQTK